MSRKRIANWNSGDFIDEPLDDEVRQWANDPDTGGTMLRLAKLQDLDLLLTNHDRGRLILEIAESNAKKRKFFLHCLYQLTYDSVSSGGQELKYLGHLLERVSPWTSRSDVIEWAAKTQQLVQVSERVDFDVKEVHDEWMVGAWSHL